MISDQKLDLLLTKKNQKELFNEYQLLVKIKSLNINLKEVTYIDIDERIEDRIAVVFINGYQNVNDMLDVIKRVYDRIYLVFYQGKDKLYELQ